MQVENCGNGGRIGSESGGDLLVLIEEDGLIPSDATAMSIWMRPIPTRRYCRSSHPRGSSTVGGLVRS